jgi:transcriptional regulator with XRE-family HTH domain
MVLLRRVIGDALRARRQAQHRTLREVSTAANVSLGYLSEIERGQKEPSSELLAAICEALGARLSEVLREVSHSVAFAEQREGRLTAVPGQAERLAPVPERAEPRLVPVPERTPETAMATTTYDGKVSVSVRQDGPLSATLRTRTLHSKVLTAA